MEPKTLRQATCEIIRTFGTGILDDPRKCLSALADLIDGDSPEARVLYNTCDERLLSRYSKAAQARSKEALESTYKGTVEYLISDCYVSEDAAKRVAGGLAQGVADAIGVGELSIVKKQKDGAGDDTNVITSPSRKSLHEAMRDTVHTYGIGILSNDTQLNGELFRQIDSTSIEAATLRRYGNQYLYAPFARAVGTGKASVLADAQNECATYLQRICGVSAAEAQAVANGLASGVAEFLGWQYTTKPGLSTVHKVVISIVAVAVVAAIGVMVYKFVIKPPKHIENPVTISFNANGADSGAVDAITCEMGEPIPLPAGNSYAREGYTFAGWGDERADDTPHGVGDTFSTSEDVTLYAQWNLGSESKPMVVNEQSYTSDSGNQVIVLTVNNASSATVDLKAEFSFLNSAGTAIDSCTVDAWSVGPGETTILEGSTTVGGVQNVSYDVSSSSPQYGDASILTCATVEEVSCNDDGLTVQVTNKGDKDITLVSCVAYGYDENGSFAYIPVNYEGEEQRMEPEDKRTVVFEGSQWASLDHKVYLYGFAR